MKVSQPNTSLVKYDTQILVSTSKKGKKTSSRVSSASTDDSSSKNEDYLNSLLPPKEFVEDGQLWVQYVSPSPATKMDVINLQDELDKRLMQRQSRE
jgi:dynein light intermediate chain